MRKRRKRIKGGKKIGGGPRKPSEKPRGRLLGLRLWAEAQGPEDEGQDEASVLAALGEGYREAVGLHQGEVELGSGGVRESGEEEDEAFHDGMEHVKKRNRERPTRRRGGSPRAP